MRQGLELIVKLAVNLVALAGPRVRAKNDSLQLVPPKFTGASDVASGDEERGGRVELFQQARGFMQVIRVAVLEGDGDGKSSQPPRARLKPIQAHAPVSAQDLEMFGEVLRGNAQRPGVQLEAGNAVVQQNDATRAPTSPHGSSLDLIAITPMV